VSRAWAMISFWLASSTASAAFLPSASPTVPLELSRQQSRPLLRMAASDEPAPRVRVELVAQRSAVGSLTAPQQQQESETAVGVPPPSAAVPEPPSLAQRARTPFIGLTVLATAAAVGIQSKRLYKQKVEQLLADFAATMMAYLGNDAEMAATVRSFRQQLGPGSFRERMFTKFVTALVNDKPLGVPAIQQLKKTIELMKLSEEVTAAGFADAAVELSKKPAMLGKLTFLAERAAPAAARSAELRAKFPNWDADTVGTLQRAMLENLYREMCHPLADGSEPPAGGDVLLLSPADCARLMSETQAAKKEAIRVAAEEEEERQRKALLEDAVKGSEPGGRPGE